MALSWCFFGWIPGRNVILGADALPLVSPWLRPGATMHNLTLTDPLWQFYPWLREFRSAILRGRFPLWDPSIRAGVPIAANPISAYFFPLTWLVVPLGVDAGVSALAVLRPALAAFFAFLYFRRGKHSGAAALLGGATYGFSLPFLVWAEHPQDNVFLLLPLLLLTIDETIRRPGLRSVAKTAALLFLITVAGHPESALHLALFALAYSVVQVVRLSPANPGRGLLHLAAAGLWACALSLFLLYPNLLVVVESTAFRQAGPRTLLLPLRTLLAAVWPGYFGNPAAGAVAADLPYNFNEAAFFFGLAPLALAAGALVSSGRRRRLPPPVFWAALAVVMLLLIFAAPRSPVFLSIPFVGRTYQNRLAIPLGLALGALAAGGLDAARREARARRSSLAALAGLAAAALAIFAASPSHRPGARQLGWECAVILIGAASVSLLRRKAAAATALLCVGQLLDLWRAGAGYHSRSRPEQIFPELPILQALRTETGDGRVLGIGLVLPPNSATVYGLRDVRGYDAVEGSHFRAARDQLAAWDPNPGRPEMTAAGFTPRSAGLLQLFSVRALLLPPRLQPAGNLAARYGIQLSLAYDDRNGKVYRVAGIPGRFQAIARVTPAVLAVAADPRHESLVEGIDSPALFPEAGSAMITVEKDEPERLLLRTSCPGPFFLRVSDAFDDGWRAALDGKPLRLYRADAAFRGAIIPPGDHRLEMRYRMPGSPFTLPVSIAAALLLAAGLAARGRKPIAAPPPATG